MSVLLFGDNITIILRQLCLSQTLLFSGSETYSVIYENALKIYAKKLIKELKYNSFAKNKIQLFCKK